MPIKAAYNNHVLGSSAEPGDWRLRVVTAATAEAALELQLRMVLALDCNNGLDPSPFPESYTLYHVHLSAEWQAE